VCVRERKRKKQKMSETDKGKEKVCEMCV